MAGTSSFDISTGADLQEVDNAVNQALKEIGQRYDFKGTHCGIEFDRAKAEIRLSADDQFRMDALLDVLARPFDERPGLQEYAEPGGGPHVTYCGT